VAVGLLSVDAVVGAGVAGAGVVGAGVAGTGVVGAGVAGAVVGAGVAGAAVGSTTALTSCTVAPVTTAAAPMLLASSLLMELVRDVSCVALSFISVRLVVMAAESVGGTATLNSTFSVPSKSLNFRPSD